MRRNPSDALAHSQALHAQRGDLMDELSRSVAVASLWPGVFDLNTDGSKPHVRSVWVTSYSNIVFAILRDNEERRFEVGDLPACLRPSEAVKAKYAQDFPRGEAFKALARRGILT